MGQCFLSVNLAFSLSWLSKSYATIRSKYSTSNIVSLCHKPVSECTAYVSTFYKVHLGSLSLVQTRLSYTRSSPLPPPPPPKKKSNVFSTALQVYLSVLHCTPSPSQTLETNKYHTDTHSSLSFESSTNKPLFVAHHDILAHFPISITPFPALSVSFDII